MEYIIIRLRFTLLKLIASSHHLLCTVKAKSEFSVPFGVLAAQPQTGHLSLSEMWELLGMIYLGNNANKNQILQF